MKWMSQVGENLKYRSKYFSWTKVKDRLVHLLCRPQSTYKTVTFERLNFLQMPLILLYIIAHLCNCTYIISRLSYVLWLWAFKDSKFQNVMVFKGRNTKLVLIKSSKYERKKECHANLRGYVRVSALLNIFHMDFLSWSLTMRVNIFNLFNSQKWLTCNFSL